MDLCCYYSVQWHITWSVLLFNVRLWEQTGQLRVRSGRFVWFLAIEQCVINGTISGICKNVISMATRAENGPKWKEISALHMCGDNREFDMYNRWNAVYVPVLMT